jgi:acylphosphatase
MTTKAVRAVISGRVQGVWYRGWTVDEARIRRLTGWVRNRNDGSVEALFAGPPDKVDDMLKACRLGPPSAEVTDIVVEPVSDPLLHDFDQRPTC